MQNVHVFGLEGALVWDMRWEIFYSYLRAKISVKNNIFEVFLIIHFQFTQYLSALICVWSQCGLYMAKFSIYYSFKEHKTKKLKNQCAILKTFLGKLYLQYFQMYINK